jgi:hypothetical protein
MDFADIVKEDPRILECYEFQGWIEMLTVLGEASVELVREFYSHIYEYGNGYFVTWLRGREIQVTAKLISTLIGTARVIDSPYPWTFNDQPPQEVLISSFYSGGAHNLSLSTTRGFKLNDLPTALRLTYRILESCIHPIDRKDPITLERSLCLYAV